MSQEREVKAMSLIQDDAEHVPLKLKLCLSIGSFANSMLSVFAMANIAFYYEEKLLLSKTLVGLAWIIFAAWNTINDPLFAYIIDNTRTRLGRRIPYVRYVGLCYGAAFIFCWFPIAQIGDQIGLFFNLLAALSLLDTGYTILSSCFFALPKEIVVTAVQRSSLAVWMSLADFVNIGAGVVLGIVFLTGQGSINPIFQPFMVLVGIAGSLLLFTTSFGLKENMSAQEQSKESFVVSFKTTLKNKPFWIVMIPGFVFSIIVPLMQTGVLYYINYVIPGQNYLPIAGGFAIGILAGLFLSPKFIKKWQPKRIAIMTFYFMAATFIAIFITGKNSTIAAFPFGFFGFELANSGVVTAVIMGDVIDNDELITGKRRETIYGGVYAVISKPGLSIANWAFLTIINVFGFLSPVQSGDVPVKQAQSELAITGILIAICLIPAIGMLISAIVARWYTLDGAEWLKKKEFIRESHEKKEKEFLATLEKNRLTQDQPK